MPKWMPLRSYLQVMAFQCGLPLLTMRLKKALQLRQAEAP
jgi:hypothetical protein